MSFWCCSISWVNRENTLMNGSSLDLMGRTTNRSGRTNRWTSIQIDSRSVQWCHSRLWKTTSFSAGEGPNQASTHRRNVASEREKYRIESSSGFWRDLAKNALSRSVVNGAAVNLASLRKHPSFEIYLSTVISLEQLRQYRSLATVSAKGRRPSSIERNLSNSSEGNETEQFSSDILAMLTWEPSFKSTQS